MPRFAVIDLETTGLSPASDRIVEFGALLVDTGPAPLPEPPQASSLQASSLQASSLQASSLQASSLQASSLQASSQYVSFLVNPHRPIPAHATRVHGITDAHVRGLPPFVERADVVVELLRDRVVIGHNVGFDLSFLAAELARAGVDWAKPPRLDTMYAARRTLTALSTHRLEVLRSHLGIEAGPAHRVEADIVATWSLARLLAAHDATLADAGVPPLDGVPAWLLTRP